MKLVPVHLLSIEGDEINHFVKKMCKGKWPTHGARVRVTCGDLPYPMHYQFMNFRRGYGEEASCKFSMGDDETEEFVVVSLAHIKTWNDMDAWSSESVGNRLAFDGHPQKILVKLHDGIFEHCYLKNVTDNGIGPQLLLSKEPNLMADQTVYISMLQNIITDKFVTLPYDLIVVRGCDERVMPIPAMVKPIFYRDSFVLNRAEVESRLVTFFGYSSGYNGKVYAHFVKDAVHLKVLTTDLINMTFVRAGVQ